ncbi:hypothetical protein JCM16303_006416 [Sporobolomyces ruberrimus]
MAYLSALPHETLLNIMLQLDYKDLKCLSRVCKTFHRLEKDSQLDLKMFRKGLSPVQGTKKILAKKQDGYRNLHHPILEYVELTSSSIDDIVPSRYRYKRFNRKIAESIDFQSFLAWTSTQHHHHVVRSSGGNCKKPKRNVEAKESIF